ncbi:Hsp20/alpha crystallin family protein [bacterium]|nr:Hsp20/alpha crystallin family protein [bacterium]
MMAMQNAFDRMFEDNWRSFAEMGGSALSLDIDEADDHYVVTTELPGIKAENINIRVHDGMLTIDAEMPERTTEHEGKRALVRERRYGRFSRTIRLPQPVNIEQAEAQYQDGVLTLNLPKAAEAQLAVI